MSRPGSGSREEPGDLGSGQSRSEDVRDVVLSVEGLSKSFENGDGTVTEVLDGVDLTVRSGDIVCLLGRSGCGKSTLLQCISGLLEPDAGTIRIDHDSLGYVFQEDRLLDWLSVRENIRIVLRSKGVPTGERQERVRRYLDLVGLRQEAATYPNQLSGGMKQRVAIARALAIEPDVLLLDEPFSQLDEITARSLRERFLKMIWELDQSVLFVTHNATEAAFLSTRIAVLNSTLPTQLVEQFWNPLDYPRDIDSREVLQLKKEIVSHI